MADTLESAFSSPADDVLRHLETDQGRGLRAADVSSRLVKYGPNRLRQQKKKSAAAILLHQFNSIIVGLLAAAALMSFLLGDLAEGGAIVVVLLINGSIGFFTELRAARSMEAILRIAEVRTRVRRDGVVGLVDARDLVPGDIVILDAGDIVTADLRLIESASLRADESVLTGESVPVQKSADPVTSDAVIGDRFSMAYKGTAITQGAGEGVVVATGMETEIGRISSLAQASEPETAPLERRLDLLGHRLVRLTLALAALTIVVGIARGNDVAIMVQTGVALAVAAVPEGLPVVATLSLARGMWRMSRRNALIRRLSSVETLGATTVILTDKTGTLTENRMTAVRYMIDGRDVDIAWGGKRADIAAEAGQSPALDWALRIGALCNNADLGDGAEGVDAGDPMEIALLSVSRDAGLTRPDLLSETPEILDHGFDPEAKMMATSHASRSGFLIAVKGAPEAVLDCCTQVLGREGVRPISAEDVADWQARNTAAAQSGLRLLGLAMKAASDADEDPYQDLTLVGMVCLLDPVREDVPAAIEACRTAGVRVVMMTGDHADTARAIAQRSHLGGETLSVIGSGDVARMTSETASDADRERILGADVFARVAPDTKLALVSQFQQAGHVVAMTGDGVNDAPALKKADIGIAMGLRGTQVAQEAAHMVLRDDAFATIIAAMRQGRVIFDNIRKFVVYLMSCNVSEVLVVGLAVGVGLPTPLLPLQILFLNLVTDVFPAFALGLGRGDDMVMRRPPRDPAEAIVNAPRWRLIGLLGAAITLATLGAFVVALQGLDLEPGPAVTVAFLTLALAQLWNVFNVRDPGGALLRNEVTRNPYVWGAILLCLGLIGLAIWLPPLAGILGLPFPGSAGLLLAAGASFVPLVLGQIWLVLAPDDCLETRREGGGPQGPARRERAIS